MIKYLVGHGLIISFFYSYNYKKYISNVITINKIINLSFHFRFCPLPISISNSNSRRQTKPLLSMEEDQAEGRFQHKPVEI